MQYVNHRYKRSGTLWRRGRHKIIARCQESDTGARNIEVILNRTLLPSFHWTSVGWTKERSDAPITCDPYTTRSAGGC